LRAGAARMATSVLGSRDSRGDGRPEARVRPTDGMSGIRTSPTQRGGPGVGARAGRPGVGARAGRPVGRKKTRPERRAPAGRPGRGAAGGPPTLRQKERSRSVRGGPKGAAVQRLCPRSGGGGARAPADLAEVVAAPLARTAAVLEPVDLSFSVLAVTFAWRCLPPLQRGFAAPAAPSARPGASAGGFRRGFLRATPMPPSAAPARASAGTGAAGSPASRGRAATRCAPGTRWRRSGPRRCCRGWRRRTA
jgi:hypothetical protein